MERNRATTSPTALTLPPTLSRTDTHRVAAVLEKAIERLQLLTLLNYDTPASFVPEKSSGTPTGTSAREHENVNRGVGSILDEQKRLEARYEALLAATQKQHNNPMDPSLDPLCFSHVENHQQAQQLEELRQISQSLKGQSKLLCRQLKDNPNDADNWRKIVGERQELITMLLTCVRELMTSNNVADPTEATSAKQLSSYETFAKKVLDEQSAAIWADELVKKEKETNQNVKQLQNEVKYERQMKEEERDKRQKIIADLKTELRLLKQHVKTTMDKIRAGTEASSEALQREALETERKIRKTLMYVQDKKEMELQVDDDFLKHTQFKTQNLDDMITTWTEKSQDAQRKTEGKKHQMERVRTEQAEKLKDKLDQKDVAEVNKKSREEEAKRRAEDHLKLEQMNQARFMASTKLQASIKGFFTRQLLIGLKKKMAKKRH